MLDEKSDIKNMIYEIRGKQVMLDSNLAKLYQCKNGTKTINQSVNRNKERFPSDFYFQLTKSEYEILKSQIGTSSLSTYGGVRKMPYVFTEQGVAMLSSVLRTEVVSKVSVNIMRAFVEMRKLINTNLVEQKYVNNLVFEHDKDIKELKDLFDGFKEDTYHIMFKNQRYDSHSLLLDIFNKSKESIIIIDNYIDKSILDILRDTKKKVTIITNKYNNKDYENYKTQYNNVKVIINNNYHDRFIIVDKMRLYHCGSSFKDLGLKCFLLSEINDKTVLNNLLKSLNI